MRSGFSGRVPRGKRCDTSGNLEHHAFGGQRLRERDIGELARLFPRLDGIRECQAGMLVVMDLCVLKEHRARFR